MKGIALAQAVLLAFVLCKAAPAQRTECKAGQELAASLLFPYFEVALDDPNSQTTLISVIKLSDSPKLVRVTLWTDWALPTLGFDVYLDGADVQTINLRDVFNGTIPSTGSTLIGFGGCSATPPSHGNPALSGLQVADLRARHTGRANLVNARCDGENHGDNVARGYITADVIGFCSGVQMVLATNPPGTSPATPPPPAAPYGSYWHTGTYAFDNVLWGETLFVDAGNNFAQGSEAVGIWVAENYLYPADRGNTFYGRYNGYDGSDRRVPAPNGGRTRFVQGGAFSGGTHFLVWQDTRVPGISEPICGNRPPWYPLRTLVDSWDEDGNNYLRGPFTGAPLATQKVTPGQLGIFQTFGMADIGFLGSSPSPTVHHGGWVQTIMDASGRFSVSFNATLLPGFRFQCSETP